MRVLAAIEDVFGLPSGLLEVKNGGKVHAETFVVLVGPTFTNEGARPVPPELNGSGWVLLKSGKLINPLPAPVPHEERELVDIDIFSFENPIAGYPEAAKEMYSKSGLSTDAYK